MAYHGLGGSESYRIEIFYLWIPSPAVAIEPIGQWVEKGGHFIPDEDVERRYHRRLRHFVRIYAPLADAWKVWDNTERPARLTLIAANATLPELEKLHLP